MVLEEPCSHQGKHRQHDQGVAAQTPQTQLLHLFLAASC